MRLELKCGFRILTQVVDILFLRRRMLYPAELRDHIAVHRVIIDKNRRFVNLQAGQRTVGNTEKVGFCTIAVQRM